MPRGLPTEPIPKLNDPTYEEELRATANWIRSRTLCHVPGLPVTVMFDGEFANWIAATMDSHARLLEGDA